MSPNFALDKPNRDPSSAMDTAMLRTSSRSCTSTFCRLDSNSWRVDGVWSLWPHKSPGISPLNVDWYILVPSGSLTLYPFNVMISIGCVRNNGKSCGHGRFEDFRLFLFSLKDHKQHCPTIIGILCGNNQAARIIQKSSWRENHGTSMTTHLYMMGKKTIGSSTKNPSENITQIQLWRIFPKNW